MSLSASVVICTHDRPAHLRRSADSVLAQTRRPIELVVVNDGADETDADLARQAAEAGVRFVGVRRHRPSLPASRNRGMDAATGDVVLLLDDDMILPPGFLAALLSLYEADAAGQAAGIGAVAVPTAPRRIGQRVWDVAAGVLGQGRWHPRRCAARSVRLSAGLRGRLTPARRLTGGTISLRRAVAKEERFDEGLPGYALGEDREFTYRVGQRRALFCCPGLRVAHETASPARPDMPGLGRMYVLNTLRIVARSTGGGAGAGLLAGYELAGTALLHGVWLVLRNRRAHAGFLAGMARGLVEAARNVLGEMLCGR